MHFHCVSFLFLGPSLFYSFIVFICVECACVCIGKVEYTYCTHVLSTQCGFNFVGCAVFALVVVMVVGLCNFYTHDFARIKLFIVSICLQRC